MVNDYLIFSIIRIDKFTNFVVCIKANIEHISLNSEREVYVCLNLTKCLGSKPSGLKNKIPPKYQYPSLKLGGNSMWQILNIPLTYISSNFPIKMSSIDPDGITTTSLLCSKNPFLIVFIICLVIEKVNIYAWPEWTASRTTRSWRANGKYLAMQTRKKRSKSRVESCGGRNLFASPATTRWIIKMKFIFDIICWLYQLCLFKTINIL